MPSPAGKLVLAALLGLLNSGWYAIPKARLYEALPGQSGAAVAVGGIAGLAGAAVPLVLGAVAESFGLGATMWILLVAPVALLLGAAASHVPSGGSGARHVPGTETRGAGKMSGRD